MLVAFWNMIPNTCCGLPTPAVPAVALFGLALSQAMNSFRSFVGRLFRPMIICELLVSRPTGSKSFGTIVLQRVDCTVHNMRAPDSIYQRVAVWRGARHPADADASSRPAYVLYNDGLPK